MPRHRLKYTKVNAPVDAGVEGIVSALGEFPSLETVESCEGDENNGAWVCFRFGSYWEHPWRELTGFVLGYLAPGLVAEVGDDASVRIQVTASGQIFGEMSVRPGATHRVETALHKLAVRSSACQPRRSAYCGGTSGTSQSRC